MASIPEFYSSTANSTLLYGNYYSELSSEPPVPPSAAELCDGVAMWSNNTCTKDNFTVPYNLNDFCLLEGFLSSSSSSLSSSSSSSSSTEKLEIINCDGVVPSFSSDEYRNYISDNTNNINNISLIDGNFGEIAYNNNNNNNIVPLHNNTLDHLLSGEDYYCRASASFSPEFKPFSLVEGEQNKWGTQSNRLNGIVEESYILKVGRYSEEERKERIVRYLKKRNQRNFNKTIKYACRKTLADRRVRVRGRFARNNNDPYHHHDDQQIEAEKIIVDDHDQKDMKLCCDDGLQVIKYDNDEDWLQNFSLCCCGLIEDQLIN